MVNEIAEIKGCNTTIFLEARKRQDLYMWVSRVGTGPSAKFLVQNGEFAMRFDAIATLWERFIHYIIHLLLTCSTHHGRAEDDGQCAGRLASAADL